MNPTHSITPSAKFKRLSFDNYEHIVREVTKHDALYKGRKRNTGRTALIRSLALDVGASVSTVYAVLKDARITILDSKLREHHELSASASFHRRH